MNRLQKGIVLAGCSVVLAACGGELSGPADLAGETGAAGGSEAGGVAGLVRVRCELQSGRSKVSVDGNDLSPRGGLFTARVNAAGGTATSASRRAVGDEVEFDFDSNGNDVAAGATPLSVNFIAVRDGADVTGEILNAEGVVIASRGAECEVR